MKSTFVLFLFLAVGLQAQDLTIVKKNGKFGFEKNGREIIPCTYDYECNFSEELALVRLNDKWGYIDSAGNVQIPFKFQKAEPFLTGQAFVKENNLVGIIYNDGSYLIKPEYKEIRAVPYGFELRNDDKFGCFFSENNEIIPAKYSEIYSEGYYSNCKVGDQHWDLYFRGKLLIDSMQSKIEFFQGENFFKVFKNGKIGIYEVEKGWIVAPKYGRIDKQKFADYKIGSYNFDFLFVLYTVEEYDSQFMNEYEDYYTYFQLAKSDGSLISEAKMKGLNSYVAEFDEIKCNVCLQTNVDNNLTVVNSNFEVKKLNYKAFKKQGNWFIAESENKAIILDRFLTPIDSFLKVESYFELNYENTDWEVSDVVYKEILDEPFILIIDIKDGATVKAVYDLEEKRRISPWIDYAEVLQISRENLNGKTFYRFYGSASGVGYFIQGMKDIVPMELEKCDLIMDFLITKKFDASEHFLYHLEDGQFIQICHEQEVKLSETIIKYVEGEEDERSIFGNVSLQFIYTLNQDSKFGVVAISGKYINGKFDSINPVIGFSQYIRIYKNGKQGILNLINGNLISPVFDYSLTLQYAMDQTEVYATVDGNDFPYYLTEKGKKFYSLEPKYLIFKEKGLYGLKTNNDFDDGEKIATVQIQPEYKSMKQDPLSKCFIVSGTNKKLGLINQCGDTLIDFKYDKLESALISNYFDGSIFYCQIGKKKGVVSQFQGELVPVNYDQIEPYGNDNLQNTFVVSVGKKKGIHGSKVLILPVEFESISKQTDFESTAITYFIGEKGGKKYVQGAYFTDAGCVPNSTPLSQPYDIVLGSYGFLKTGNLYHKYYLRNNEFMEETGDLDVQFSNELFTVVYKDGKYGAIDLQGNDLVPFIYESASFMEGRSEVMIGIENGQTYYIYVETNERYTPQQW